MERSKAIELVEESLRNKVRRIEWLEENILLVERIDGTVMIVRRGYPCPHRTRSGDYVEHIHFHVTDKTEIDTPEKLWKRLNWLEAGFWSDSCIWDSERGLKNLIRQFLSYRCAGALQPF